MCLSNGFGRTSNTRRYICTPTTAYVTGNKAWINILCSTTKNRQCSGTFTQNLGHPRFVLAFNVTHTLVSINTSYKNVSIPVSDYSRDVMYS